MSSEELVRRCQRARSGDMRAFEEFLAVYKQSVFRTAYRLMANRQDAEDMAQEVFLKVYRSIGTLEDPATVAAWIQRITINVCLDTLTKQRRHPTTPFPSATTGEPREDDAFADPAPHASPEAAALSSELRRCIEATLMQLGALERAILVLRDLEDRSYQEIAEVFKSGLSATKMRIHRARQAFQRLFDRICPGLRTVE